MLDEDVLPCALEWDATTSSVPQWARFEAAWYVASYPEAKDAIASGACEDALDHYRRLGQTKGFSPNIWFDEAWYRATNPDVVAAIKAGDLLSGFQHYLHYGHPDRSPHWLFSEAFYRAANPELTEQALKATGHANGYAHYLSGSEADFRTGSLFFDPSVRRPEVRTRANHPTSENDNAGPFGAFLRSPKEAADQKRCSWYFDPHWYLEHYPQARAEVEAGKYRNALHHYLTTGERDGLSPQAGFSEDFYRATYPDVEECIVAGHFRSGYDHFLAAGAMEGRQPAQDVPLATYASQAFVREDVDSGIFRDPFAHWVAHEEHRKNIVPDEIHTKMMFCREAAGLLVDAGRKPLDFSYEGRPAVSILMVLHNQFPLTMMALSALRGCFRGAIDLIIIDSGSRDETRDLEHYVQGATIRHLEHNASFLLSCNMALEMAKAEAVLYLNNDVRLAPGAIENGLRRLGSDGRIGAVGGKIIRTNGKLQEAGSIIWRDGGAYGYLRDADPNCPEANFVRDVDYCSGPFLLVPTKLARNMGGFDTAYAPAYFEESDFCVRLIRSGYRVVYDPSVVIEHLEFGSSSSSASHALMQRNRRIFLSKQADFLRNQYPAHLSNVVMARSRPPTQPRVLFIEDRVPLRRLGSGYVRSNDIVRSMARQGCTVTIFPVDAYYHSLGSIYGDFPDTVEVLFDRSARDLDGFLEERAGAFDLVWIGRTHNLARLLPVLHKNHRYLPGTRFVLDTEAVVSPRLRLRDEVLEKGADATRPALEDELRSEFECAYFCQQVVAVNEHEAEMIRQAGHGNVTVLGHSLRPSPTPRSFGERHGLLFVGAIVDEESPNLDGLLWFAREVMPLVRAELGPDTRLTVVGSCSRGVDLRPLHACEGLEIVGEAEDLRGFHDSHRVFVAPTRFAGGIPYKIHESAALGLPVVASDLLIEQLGWTAERDILSGGKPDPQRFAASIVELYRNQALWGNVRDAAIGRVEQECDPARFDAAVAGILKNVRRADALLRVG
ncbi:glycosyltransferase [Acetobacter estunensis NRIC 0472]|uniref:Glycosyltransferase n=1 Tax=Acetobacter estunensis TaxID=104097 RepID=A0A967B2V3_9PROT|nr:glycosyltransferase [Acetobacter estunensis]NHO52707.1 glycosyltransferase [Acetobacter estunensis]GBQ22972.1 glycosyltransferase [Acetobacter estunensis NRIC 0472]